ncbi:MAG: DUF4258 domain-containing protein [Bacteroidetes bacterium]|jgi:hypothetical protein|nr:DUF4258 domain-containing protein [Bacteroidota bacterium]
MTRDVEQALAWIQRQAASGTFRVTQHAAVEMDEEDILLGDVLDAIASGQILENYPDHRRGACCLLYGTTTTGRPLHVVCTTGGALLILITVYEPMLPKWKTPTERNR